MDRRMFVKVGLGASALLALNKYSKVAAKPLGDAPQVPFDLVAVRGGEPDVMFDSGISALGGMQAFVKKGQKVVIKPNIGWDVPPERAGNTHPKLVARIIQRCYEAGAKEVYVFDHTCDNWQKTYANSGIERAVKDAGGKMAPAHTESYYHDVKIPSGKTLTSAKEHELILESDVFINVPILKSHNSARLTMAMKNLMGAVWDRGAWHSNDLHQCIADFAAYRKPALNVLDAYYVMKRNGPRGVSVEDVVSMKAQILSTDIVAVDAAGAKMFGVDPGSIRHLQIAADKKIGKMDLEHLNIKRIAL